MIQHETINIFINIITIILIVLRSNELTKQNFTIRKILNRVFSSK